MRIGPGQRHSVGGRCFNASENRGPIAPAPPSNGSTRPAGPADVPANRLPARGSAPCDISAAPADWGDRASINTCRQSLLSTLLPDGSDATLRNLLSGRRVAILWDLDNVDFFAPACSAPLQVRRLRALVAEAGGRLVLCRAYGNTDTVRRLAGVLPLLEGCGLLHVEAVAVRQDAADLRLVHDAMEFCSAVTAAAAATTTAATAIKAAHGSVGGAALLCVSQDTDFAAPLRHLSERGVRTLAVSPHQPRRRTHESMEPATYFRRLPLPTACWAALKWEPRAARVTAAEADWLRQLLAPAREPGAEGSACYRSGAGGVAAAGAARGGCVGGGQEWVNGSGGAAGTGWTAGAGAEDAVASAARGSEERESKTVERSAASAGAAAAAAAGSEGEGLVSQSASVAVRDAGAAEEEEAGGAERRGGNGRTGDTGAAAPGAVVAPPGLESYTRGGARCPGVATRLWLNPHFTSEGLT